MTIVTPADRPKSVRNRYVIEVFGRVLCCPLDVEVSVGIGVFVIGLSQTPSFSLNMKFCISHGLNLKAESKMLNAPNRHDRLIER